MNKALILLLLPSLALADTNTDPIETSTAWKQGLTLFTTTLAGTLAAGPVGMVFGAAGGGWLGEHIERADRLGQVERERNRVAEESHRQRQQIDQLELRLDDMSSALYSRLAFQVMFATGTDELNSEDFERLKMLAGYLIRNPDLQVRLDGYADPRGTDEYNNVLAMYRAQNVAAALNQLGVPKSRIAIFHHGASMPTGASYDLDTFALQRRVEIEVFQVGETTNAVAMDP